MQDLAKFGVILVVSGIVVSIGSQILGEIKTSDTMSVVTTTNESVNFVANNTYYTLANQPVKSVSAVYDDAANSNSFGSSYWTSKTGNDGSVKLYTNSTVGSYPNTTTGVHYVSYTSYEVGYNITENAQEGLDSLGSWLPTIGLVLAATLVIGVLINQFQKKNKVAGF